MAGREPLPGLWAPFPRCGRGWGLDSSRVDPGEEGIDTIGSVMGGWGEGADLIKAIGKLKKGASIRTLPLNEAISFEWHGASDADTGQS